jgi:hypothetical protein
LGRDNKKHVPTPQLRGFIQYLSMSGKTPTDILYIIAVKRMLDGTGMPARIRHTKTLRKYYAAELDNAVVNDVANASVLQGAFMMATGGGDWKQIVPSGMRFTWTILRMSFWVLPLIERYWMKARSCCVGTCFLLSLPNGALL